MHNENDVAVKRSSIWLLFMLKQICNPIIIYPFSVYKCQWQKLYNNTVKSTFTTFIHSLVLFKAL